MASAQDRIKGVLAGASGGSSAQSKQKTTKPDMKGVQSRISETIQRDPLTAAGFTRHSGTKGEISFKASDGTTYRFDSSAADWMRRAYQAQYGSYYGTDAQDQANKASGAMPRSFVQSYDARNSTDQALYQMGLPSSKWIGKYLGEYEAWRGSGTVYQLDDDAKAYVQDQWKKSWKYSGSLEDMKRQQEGRMPEALEEKYFAKGGKQFGLTKSFASQYYLEQGLPDEDELGGYLQGYASYLGASDRIQQFYTEVSKRALEAELTYGIRDDDGEYVIGKRTKLPTLPNGQEYDPNELEEWSINGAYGTDAVTPRYDWEKITAKGSDYLTKIFFDTLAKEEWADVRGYLADPQKAPKKIKREDYATEADYQAALLKAQEAAAVTEPDDPYSLSVSAAKWRDFYGKNTSDWHAVVAASAAANAFTAAESSREEQSKPRPKGPDMASMVSDPTRALREAGTTAPESSGALGPVIVNAIADPNADHARPEQLPLATGERSEPTTLPYTPKTDYTDDWLAYAQRQKDRGVSRHIASAQGVPEEILDRVYGPAETPEDQEQYDAARGDKAAVHEILTAMGSELTAEKAIRDFVEHGYQAKDLKIVKDALIAMKPGDRKWAHEVRSRYNETLKQFKKEPAKEIAAAAGERVQLGEETSKTEEGLRQAVHDTWNASEQESLYGKVTELASMLRAQGVDAESAVLYILNEKPTFNRAFDRDGHTVYDAVREIYGLDEDALNEDIVFKTDEERALEATQARNKNIDNFISSMSACASEDAAAKAYEWFLSTSEAPDSYEAVRGAVEFMAKCGASRKDAVAAVGQRVVKNINGLEVSVADLVASVYDSLMEAGDSSPMDEWEDWADEFGMTRATYARIQSRYSDNSPSASTIKNPSEIFRETWFNEDGSVKDIGGLMTEVFGLADGTDKQKFTETMRVLKAAGVEQAQAEAFAAQKFPQFRGDSAETDFNMFSVIDKVFNGRAGSKGFTLDGWIEKKIPDPDPLAKQKFLQMFPSVTSGLDELGQFYTFDVENFGTFMDVVDHANIADDTKEQIMAEYIRREYDLGHIDRDTYSQLQYALNDTMSQRREDYTTKVIGIFRGVADAAGINPFEFDNGLRRAGMDNRLDPTEAARNYFIWGGGGIALLSDEDRKAFAQLEPEQRTEALAKAWTDVLTDEQRTAYVTDFNDTLAINPDIHKNIGDSITTYIMFGGLTKLATGLFSGAISFADMITGTLGNKDGEDWRLTTQAKKLASEANAAYALNPEQGKAAENVGTVMNVMDEFARMYVEAGLGSFLAGKLNWVPKDLTKAKGLSKAFGWAANKARALYQGGKAIPFIVNATGNYYNEAREAGQDIPHASFYAAIMGHIEGATEALATEKWTGGDLVARAVANDSTLFTKTGIKGLLTLNTLVSSYLAEDIEERISYLGGWATKGLTWEGYADSFKDFLGKFDWQEFAEDGHMGGLIGLVGAAMSAPANSVYASVYNFVLDNPDYHISSIADMYIHDRIVAGIPASAQEAYRARGMSVLSSEQWVSVQHQLSQANVDARKAQSTYEGAVQDADGKLQHAQSIYEEKSAALQALLTQENQGSAEWAAEVEQATAAANTALNDLNAQQVQHDTDIKAAKETMDRTVMEMSRAAAKAQDQINAHSVYLHDLYHGQLANLRPYSAISQRGRAAATIREQSDAALNQLYGETVVRANFDSIDTASEDLVGSTEVTAEHERAQLEWRDAMAAANLIMENAKAGTLDQYLQGRTALQEIGREVYNTVVAEHPEVADRVDEQWGYDMALARAAYETETKNGDPNAEHNYELRKQIADQRAAERLGIEPVAETQQAPAAQTASNDAQASVTMSFGATGINLAENAAETENIQTESERFEQADAQEQAAQEQTEVDMSSVEDSEPATGDYAAADLRKQFTSWANNENHWINSLPTSDYNSILREVEGYFEAVKKGTDAYTAERLASIMEAARDGMSYEEYAAEHAFEQEQAAPAQAEAEAPAEAAPEQAPEAAPETAPAQASEAQAPEARAENVAPQATPTEAATPQAAPEAPAPSAEQAPQTKQKPARKKKTAPAPQAAETESVGKKAPAPSDVVDKPAPAQKKGPVIRKATENEIATVKDFCDRTGREVVFEEMDAAPNGKVPAGFVDANGVIHINSNVDERVMGADPTSPDFFKGAVGTVLIHELTHTLENSSVYGKLQRAVLGTFSADGRLITEGLLTESGKYNEGGLHNWYAAMQDSQAKLHPKRSDETDAQYRQRIASIARKEMVAYYIQENLNTQEFANRLAHTDKGICARVADWARHTLAMYKMRGNGFDQRIGRALENVQYLYTRALITSGGKASDGMREYTFIHSKGLAAYDAMGPEAVEEYGEDIAPVARFETSIAPSKPIDSKGNPITSTTKAEIGVLSDAMAGIERGGIDKLKGIADQLAAYRGQSQRRIDAEATARAIPLSEVLGHDTLFAIYGDLGLNDVKIATTLGKEGAYAKGDEGMFDMNTNTILINSQVLTDKMLTPAQREAKLKEIVLHETQHAIQLIEGDYTGTSPNTAAMYILGNVVNNVRHSEGFKALNTEQRRDAIFQALAYLAYGRDTEAYEAARKTGFQDFAQKFREYAYATYQHSIGEREARFTETHSDLEGDELAAQAQGIYSDEAQFDIEGPVHGRVTGRDGRTIPAGTLNQANIVRQYETAGNAAGIDLYAPADMSDSDSALTKLMKIIGADAEHLDDLASTAQSFQTKKNVPLLFTQTGLFAEETNIPAVEKDSGERMYSFADPQLAEDYMHYAESGDFAECEACVQEAARAAGAWCDENGVPVKIYNGGFDFNFTAFTRTGYAGYFATDDLGTASTYATGAGVRRITDEIPLIELVNQKVRKNGFEIDGKPVGNVTELTEETAQTWFDRLMEDEDANRFTVNMLTDALTGALDMSEYFIAETIDPDTNKVVPVVYRQDMLSSELGIEAEGKKGLAGSAGVHEGYFFAGKRPLIIDASIRADGRRVVCSHWTDIQSEILGANTDGRMSWTTDEIFDWAKDHDYTSVIIKNVNDTADGSLRYGTNYMFFDSYQFKTADPIVRGDDGKIIGLDQRFNLGTGDIRYSFADGGVADDSTGMNAYLNDGVGSYTEHGQIRFLFPDFDELIAEYGKQEQGMEPRARDIDVPNKIADDTAVSKLFRSLIESDVIPDDYVDKAKAAIADFAYTPLANSELQEQAVQAISDMGGLTIAAERVKAQAATGKVSALNNAVAIQLVHEAAKRGDTATALDIMGSMSVAATESGRAVNAWKLIKRGMGGVGAAVYWERAVERINERYASRIESGKMDAIDLKSPELQPLVQDLMNAQGRLQVEAAETALASKIGEMLPLSFSEKVRNWRYFSMLANPVTHWRNITGNVLMYGMRGAKNVVATGLERAFVRDPAQRTHGYGGRNRGAFRDIARQSFDNNKREITGESRFTIEQLLDVRKRSSDNKLLNALMQFNSGRLEAEDEWFLRYNYVDAFAEYCGAQGFDPSSMTQAQYTEAHEHAMEEAQKATFHDASALATWLNHMPDHNLAEKAAKFVVEAVMPFKKTPINIAKRGIEYSPAGLIKGIAQGVEYARNHNKKGGATHTISEAIDLMSSGIVGSGLAALGFFLAKSGILRGTGKDEPDKYNTFLTDTGDQDYSANIELAGIPFSVSLSAFAPSMIPLFMGVAWHEASQATDTGDTFSTALDVMSGITDPMTEMSFLSDLNEAIKSYNQNGFGGAIGALFTKAGKSYAGQFIPTLVKKVADVSSSTVYRTSADRTSPLGTTTDQFLRSTAKGIPVIAGALLEPSTDVHGEIVQRDSFFDWALAFANDFLLPGRVKVTDRDATDRELIRLYESTGSVAILPSIPSSTHKFTVQGNTHVMNAQEETEYRQAVGQAYYEAIRAVLAEDDYDELDDAERADRIEDAIKAAKKAVDNSFKERFGLLTPKKKKTK